MQDARKFPPPKPPRVMAKNLLRPHPTSRRFPIPNSLVHLAKPSKKRPMQGSQRLPVLRLNDHGLEVNAKAIRRLDSVMVGAGVYHPPGLALGFTVAVRFFHSPSPQIPQPARRGGGSPPARSGTGCCCSKKSRHSAHFPIAKSPNPCCYT